VSLVAEFQREPPARLPAVPMSHFQAPAYAPLLLRYGQTPLWLLVRDAPHRLLATWLMFETPANYLRPPRHRLTRRLDNMLMTIHGPCQIPNLTAAKIGAVRRTALDAIAHETAVRGWTAAVLALDPDLSGDQIAAWSALARQSGFTTVPLATYLADLPASETELFTKLKPDRRTKIRNAEKAGIEVIRDGGDEALRRYYRLRCETSRHNATPAIPWEHFADTAAACSGTDIFHLFLACDADSVPLAGQIAFAGAGYVYLSGVALSDRARQSGIPANDLLQWRVLNWARENGHRVVDFAGAQPASTDPKQQAIDAFKARWGTRVAHSLRLELHGSRTRRAAAALARRVLG